MKRVLLSLFVVFVVGNSQLFAQNSSGDARRELAGLKSDLRSTQSELRNMILQVEALQQELKQKDAQIAELQRLVTTIDSQCAESIKKLSAQLEAERSARVRDNEALSAAVAKELANAKNRQASSGSGSGSGKKSVTLPKNTVEIEVANGDTLSTIASAANTTVAVLKELNGLKSDRIRVGQKIKVPAP